MPTKVLVVDDSSMARAAVRRALGPAGLEVVEAVDGIDALVKLKTIPDIALVVCDFNMPRMNGMELLRVVRGDPAYGGVALILTSVADERTRAADEGGVGWLKKPVKAELMLATAQRLIAAARIAPAV